MEEERKAKIREVIGVLLLAGVLLVSGLLLIKQSSNAATFIPTDNISVSSSPSNVTETITETKSASALININKASLEELDTLPGIGPVTAQKIIDYRTQNGNFQTISEIKEVSGIGDVKYSQIKDLVTL